MNQFKKKEFTIFKNFLLLISIFLSSCTHFSIPKELAQSLNNQLSHSSLPITQNISDTPFNEKNVNKTTFTFNDSGDFIFSPGDYSIPVMTYCMKSSGSSPSNHIYTISLMRGKLAPVVQKLNLKAPFYFPTSDIQIVLWSLESGLSYDEMTQESQTMINQIIPEYRDILRESFFSSLERKWNKISDQSDGKIPPLSESMNRLENELGEIGTRLKEMRDFRNTLRDVGHNYEELSRLINIKPSNKKEFETPWSKISDNIYVRFISEGSFGNIGFLQVRVLPDSGRIINSDSQTRHKLNITSLIANPNDQTIQPLSFSPLIALTGVMTSSRIAFNPRAATLLIALTLTVYPMNWDDFFKLEARLDDVKDKDVQNEIKRGNEILQKEHDELEKPLKEAGIISGKDKKYSKAKNDTREYRKPGGIKQLEKDFDKISGVPTKAKDGTDVKTLPDGSTAIKGTKNKHGLTLEIQPPKNDLKYPDPKIRIKVRYL